MLFLSDLSCQECSTYTTTSQQEFDVPASPTGHGEEKSFSQTTNTRWRQVTRCVGHKIELLPEYAGQINTCSHLTVCAEKPENTSHTSPSARRTGSNKSRTSLSTRMDQTKDSALLEVHKRHGFSARTQTCSWQSLPSGDGAIYQDRSSTPKRMTMNDANNAALFLNATWLHFSICAWMTKQHREMGYRKMYTNRNTRDTVPRFWSTCSTLVETKGQAIHQYQNTSLAEATAQKKEQPYLREATLTDVLNTQLKDQK